MRVHDIGLYLDVEIPYPPILRRPPYPASLETRKEIYKHINELLDMDFIRKIEHNEIVAVTTPGMMENLYCVETSVNWKAAKRLTGTLYQGYHIQGINWKKTNTLTRWIV
ncbi:hypothetical protein O181_053733 [Austropuccinia psidii MF-1]|uniref:Uncharacterized protein n=1 Tax=Austropuccinia psidii MF-1 TaxID=1389203 RepID=A0A9Q3E7Y9_9BASI|nr:hypothetical protein [Austropuccinia psidii MF-1]